MTTNLKLKETFEVESKYGSFYTGGNIEWSNNTLFCQTSSTVNILNIDTGTVVKRIGNENQDDDIIQVFTKDNDKIITANKSGLLKLWTLEGRLVKQWKYIHQGPIAKLTLKNEELASGGSDSSIRIWNLQRQVCVLCLKGGQGVMSVVEFHPTEKWIFGSGDDGKIGKWETKNGHLCTVFSGAYSKVTSLCFHNDNIHFITASRDKVLILWNVNRHLALKTITVNEAIESVVSLPKKFKLPHDVLIEKDGIYIATGGAKGIIRIWNVVKCKEIYAQQNSLINKNTEEGGLAITRLLFNSELKTFAVVSQEHTILMHDLKTFNCIKQFVGFTDEILDIIYIGKDDTYLAVATNSPDIKVYEEATMNCRLLKGHTDLILALNKSPSRPDLMISSSKDNSVRLWLFEINSIQCVGIGRRHTGSVQSVAFAQSNFIVSVSQDTCIKVWQIPTTLEKDINLDCLRTEVAHQKDINTVAISPNDKMIATGSQDKSIKLWSENLDLLGILKGHRRGVWCVRFSPVDQVLLSSSADTTIKLWSIAQLNCLKTFEGHESSVLKIEFITNGMQFLSTGGDGLIKLFNIKTSECTTTLSEHDGRIWALALKKDEHQIATGGSDSLLIKWKDITEEKRQQRLQEQGELILQEQHLQNYLQNDQFLNALSLALTLDKPLHVLKIIQNVIRKGESGLSDTISELRTDQKEQLLKIAVNWNTNSKYCQPAQLVLNLLLNELQTGKFKPTGLNSILEGALPYTERHFKRLTQLMLDLYFITYTINCMQPHAR